MATERTEHRRILANEDEPRAGQFAFSFYNETHPLRGNPDTIKRMKRELAGLRGHRVVITMNGKRIDADGNEHRVRVVRTVNYRKYANLFGPGSAYAGIIHSVRNRFSDETLVSSTLSIDVVGDEDPADIDE